MIKQNIEIMKTKNILLSGLMMLILLSCKSDYGKIVEAQKQLMVAGVKGAANHIKYTVKFEIHKPVSIQEAVIKSNTRHTVLKNLVIKNLKTNSRLSDLEQIPPGTYLLTKVLPAPQFLAKIPDKFLIKIKIPGKDKSYTLSTSIKQGKTIFMP